MVTISEIRRVRSLCCLSLDNGEQYWLRSEDLDVSGLKTGSSLDEKVLQRIIRSFQYPRALNHAVSMLARRPCSRKEIYSRLIRLRYSESTSELVVFKLEREKLLDDEAFCEQWIRFRLSRRFGPSVIRQELKVKGIADDLISTAFSRLDPAEEENSALILAEKAWKRMDPSGDIRKNRQKVISALVRKGYDWDTARSACDAFLSEMKKNCPD